MRVHANPGLMKTFGDNQIRRLAPHAFECQKRVNIAGNLAVKFF